jgi:hypothetical protein
MADNTCHFGVNNFFADNGLGDVQSWLYFPADGAQMIAVVKKVFFEKGIRFIFSTRSKLPYLLKEDGSRFYDDNYEFTPGKDEVLLEGSAGYIISYGDMMYRSMDAVLRLRKEGIDVGLVNKTTLNVVDEEVTNKVGKTGFALIVESQNQRTGLGIRYGTWFLERGLSPKYAYMGSIKEGCGGLTEQIPYQGLDPTGKHIEHLRLHGYYADEYSQISSRRSSSSRASRGCVERGLSWFLVDLDIIVMNRCTIVRCIAQQMKYDHAMSIMLCGVQDPLRSSLRDRPPLPILNIVHPSPISVPPQVSRPEDVKTLVATTRRIV